MTEPDVIATHASAESVELDLVLRPELLYFQGHFPGFPILPGIVQLHWAIAFGRRHFDLGAATPGTVQVKFRSIIAPGERICLVLRNDSARGRLSFEYRDATAARSSGIVSFSA